MMLSHANTTYQYCLLYLFQVTFIYFSNSRPIRNQQSSILLGDFQNRLANFCAECGGNLVVFIGDAFLSKIGAIEINKDLFKFPNFRICFAQLLTNLELIKFNLKSNNEFYFNLSSLTLKVTMYFIGALL